MLGTSLVDRRETRLAGDAIGRKLLVGRHRTCEIKVERQDAEFFSLMGLGNEGDRKSVV